MMVSPLPQQLRYVLFDLGSTLIYFNGDWDAVMSQSNHLLTQALVDMGCKFDPVEFLASFSERMQAYYVDRDTDFIETTTQHILQSLLEEKGYCHFSEDHIRQALRAMYANSQKHWRCESDARPTLEILRQRGYRLGIVSNASDDDDVQALVDQSKLRPYFDFILSSAAVGIRKPDARIFRLALDQWATRPEYAVMVGDLLNADVLGAHNTGMAGIWITRRANPEDNRRYTGIIQADAVITELEQLPALLPPVN